jgi:hypothetical protein
VTEQQNKNPQKYQVPAVEQACRIMFCLAGNRTTHMSLIEISEQVKIHKSKA